jgi:lysophospholipase L1-like esterase
VKKTKILTILSIALLSGCVSQQKKSELIDLYTPDNFKIQYGGRIDFQNPLKPRLSGAGAYFQIKFRSSRCDILLEDRNYNNNHNYVSIVLDGKYCRRIKVSKDKTQYKIADNLSDTKHTLLVCKATEAQNGYIEFKGILCSKLLRFKDKRRRNIEFIGDSITCGFGLDASEIPCGSAEWYDQHNAFLAYGPLIARELNADWLLSSVSGIGMTRNWNSPGPTMPEVYENLYLNTDSNSIWDAGTFVPDLVSICLGTNDFSDGDGSYERNELDSDKFVADYIRFVKRIRNRYPDTQICLLSSPMLSGQKDEQLQKNLSLVLQHFKEAENDDKVHKFFFSRPYINGCSTHPDKDDHEKMAEKLSPFFKKVMNW